MTYHKRTTHTADGDVRRKVQREAERMLSMLRKHRTIGVLAAALAGVLAALLIAGGALAQHDPPHRLYGYDGDVTIDGENAAGGTRLEAVAYGRVVGSTTVRSDGSWALDVPGGLEDVSIVVDGIETDGGYITTRGGATRVMRAVTTGASTDDGDLEGDSSDSTMEGDDTGSMMDDDGGDLEGDGNGSMMDGDDGGDLEGDGSMQEADGQGSQGSDNGFPGTGTGGLADRSSVGGAVYIGAALALLALLGGLALGRRARSSVRA